MVFNCIIYDSKSVTSYLDYAGMNGIMCWANGQFGAIFDHLEDNVFRFVDYYFNPDAKNIEDRMRKIHLTVEDELACPIVAAGIVVYWIMYRNSSLGTKEIFENYYAKCLNRYIEKEKKSLDACDRNIPKEFAQRKHLQAELKRIEQSEAIYPYLKQEDIDQIKEMTSYYVKYVRNKEKKIYPKPNSPKAEVIKASFCYNPKELELSAINIRLQQVYNDMIKEGVELIPITTDMKKFFEIFSGKETTIRIAWTGRANELHYILSQWVIRGYLPKPKEGIWVVAAARFYHRKKVTNGAPIDKEFTPDELRKAGDPENPSDDLEQIIEMLKPDVRVRRYTD